MLQRAPPPPEGAGPVVPEEVAGRVAAAAVAGVAGLPLGAASAACGAAELGVGAAPAGAEDAMGEGVEPAGEGGVQPMAAG